MDNLLGREVNTFRTQIDPMIGPKPRNAFVPKNMGMEARMIKEGVYVKVLPYGSFTGSEHVVPYANIQSIRLEPMTETPLELNMLHPDDEPKKKSGR